jgi:cytoskeletal protein CcmA (bactofilin family)
MAAIFQLRRGTSNITIADGELYLHKGSGSIQFGSGSNNPITLLPLNVPVSGDINLIGNISASGDVRIGGNIYLGNANADSISALGQFTTNLVPNGTIDIGTTSAYWRNVYATNISGAIAATNGVISGSSQLSSVFEEKASATHTLISGSSQLSSVFEDKASATHTLVSGSSQITLQSTSGFTAYDLALSTISGSLILSASAAKITNDSQDISITNLNSFTGSQISKNSALATISGSLILTASNHEQRIGSIESYTSSLKTAIGVSGTDVTVNGNLTVNGTTTQINSTQVNIGDNIIELNFGGSSTTAGIYTKDATGGSTTSGSLLWDATNDYWKGGVKDAESKLLLAGGDNVITSSAQLSELNSFTSSASGRLNNLQTNSASVNISINNLNLTTASLNTSVSNINVSTSSLNTFSASVLSSLTSIYQTTASLNVASASLEQHSASINSYTASANTWSGGVDTKFATLQQVTSSILSYTASANAWSGGVDTKFTQIGVVSGSLIISASQSYVSASLMTASVKDHEERITYLEGIGGISGGNPLTQLHLWSASAKIELANLEIFTSSANTRLSNLELTSASINAWSSSLTNTFATDAEVAAGYEAKGSGIVSSSAQITPLLPTGVVSGSSQILGGSGLWSGSAQMPTGVVSGSSQVIGILSSLNSFTASLDATYATEAEVAAGYESKGRGIVSGSSQIIPLLPTGVVSGSSQIDGTAITNKSMTIAGTSVALGGSITAAKILEGTNVISSSTQITSLLPTGVVSGSSQVDLTATTNYASGILARLNAVGVVSGSSQITLGNAAGNITLATQTTGDYVASLVQGTGVTITNNSGENATPTIAIGQAVGTSANVQFGSIGVGTTASGVSGEIRATGDITAYYSSDERLKENIQPIQNALSKVEAISGNTYDWKEGFENIHSHKGNDLGVIAQEVQSIMPEIVTQRETGYLAVDYIKLVPVLIEAIKELSAKVKELESK